MSKHLPILRSICETLGKVWEETAHCQCGKLCVDTSVHYTAKEYRRIERKKAKK